MDTREILLGAAEHIERYGWIDGEMIDDSRKLQKCPACVVGAIKLVALKPGQYGDILWWACNDDAEPALEALRLALGLSINGRATFGLTDALVAWNDAPGRTAEEVVAALRLAAASVTE